MMHHSTVQRSISNIRPRGAVARSLLIAAMVVLLLVAVLSTSYGRRIELEAFDLLTVLTAPGTGDLPIVIVGIDEPSFGEFGMQWPWPRTMHALLVESLRRQGASVIAFDVVFAESSDRDADRRFATAIKRAGNVVLAGDLAIQETAKFSQVMQIEPLPLFREAGGRSGIASVDLDADLKVRRVPAHTDALWREIVRTYRAHVPGGTVREPAPLEHALVRYRGGDHSFEYVSFYQALDPAAYLPPNTFRGKIVLVGFDVRTSPEPGASQTDMFATPFQLVTGSRMPGVEVQANLVAGGLTGETVHEVRRELVVLLLIGIALLAAFLMHDWRPLPSLGWGMLIIAVLSGISWLLFSHGLWMPVLSAFFAVAMTYVAQGGSAFLTEQQKRQQIKQAFARYVSPEVVEEMTAHPERLTLGGTRRVVTIMFTDLANFTSLSEELGAEDVAKVLNVHLTGMTRIIMRHQGTVGKFIGDAVMAFWGAPLEDPDHALHACEAAVAMQLEMERHRGELLAAGLPAVFMRIGIHTGEAIVGNMGSEERFDYTTIGDSVNLASRMEGVNKLYGTGILLSAATAGALGGRMLLRRVDRVRVKGKKQAIDIYTPCDNGELAEASNRALNAYFARQWDEAAALWRKIQELRSGDRIAEVHLQRIERLRNEPPPPEWDGGTSLEKL